MSSTRDVLPSCIMFAKNVADLTSNVEGHCCNIRKSNYPYNVHVIWCTDSTERFSEQTK